MPRRSVAGGFRIKSLIAEHYTYCVQTCWCSCTLQDLDAALATNDIQHYVLRHSTYFLIEVVAQTWCVVPDRQEPRFTLARQRKLQLAVGL